LLKVFKTNLVTYQTQFSMKSQWSII